MDILYSVEEKYLQAIEELHYGELPKAMHLFLAIVREAPDYARGYYQLGCCYHYQFKDYQAAGYYYKQCITLDAKFPDVYVHYLKLLIILGMDTSVKRTAAAALAVPGVCKAHIYECMGQHAEEQQQFDEVRRQYKLAEQSTSCQTESGIFQDHLKRVGQKLSAGRNIVYTYGG